MKLRLWGVMSKRGWLTPQDDPTGTITIALTIPEGEEWEAIIRGALVPLFDSANYEESGVWTPEETASLMEQIMIASFNLWEPCP